MPINQPITESTAENLFIPILFTSKTWYRYARNKVKDEKADIAVTDNLKQH